MREEKDFMQFVLNQLYIVDENSGVKYNNQFLTYSFAMENSLRSIFDEWHFYLFSTPAIDLNGNKRDIISEKKEYSKKIKNFACRKIQKYKTSKYKEELLKYFKLMELNKLFNIEIMEVPTLQGVHQLDIRLTDEECLERYLHAEKFNSTNTKIITESQLRDYLFANLNLLDETLYPIEKEAVLQEGRLDILARDDDENMVAIEIKTEIDKRLVWQCMYYQESLKKKYKNKIRVITVCPSYPEYLLIVLKKIPDLEMYQYQLHSTNSKIEDIQIKKIH